MKGRKPLHLIRMYHDHPVRPIEARQKTGYPITVRGVTLKLPEVHGLQPTKLGMRWKFKAIYESRESDALFADDDQVSVNGSTVLMYVTEDEERGIRIAELLRQRDRESRTILTATDHIEAIDRLLAELGYDGNPAP